MDTNETIAVVFGFIFMVSIVPIIGGLMYARRERLLTHAERMKALELGAQVPDLATIAHTRADLAQSGGIEDGEKARLARKCYSTSLWVAFWGFAAAAGLGGADVNAGVAYAIASSTGAIGVTAIICGTILASRPAPSSHYPNGYAKATNNDADAFDVVSRRG
jgi:hypothetical protein